MIGHASIPDALNASLRPSDGASDQERMSRAEPATVQRKAILAARVRRKFVMEGLYPLQPLLSRLHTKRPSPLEARRGLALQR